MAQSPDVNRLGCPSRDGWTPRTPGKRMGIVLLIVLAAIVLLGTALAEVSRSSSRARIAVLQRQRALQQTWGMLSCQRAILPAAEGLMLKSDAIAAEADGNRKAFPNFVSDQLRLGSQTFVLILADEDAKANLNVIYDLGGEAACQKTLRDLINLGDFRSVRLQPRRRSQNVETATDSQQKASRLGTDGDEEGDVAADESVTLDPENLAPALVSWGDIFDFRAISSGAGDLRQLAAMTRGVTLWSSGRLNVWRASDEAIIAICRDVVQDGLARRIQQRIRGASLQQINILLGQTVTNEKDRQQLSRLLADSSQCASLWIEASDGNTRRQQLTIRMPDETGLQRTIGFEFP
ncbi:hypothetical protein CA13_40360 [Planctomycetes bacterium CA13]|uniref:General secretion pathway protein K n=1 Tax=Novipirellula herctigrandis TaxID=2527986 RepID=A0A5C5Z7U3_9BACT|nr:hypothetical protein CA13_40360 [Planctomycetes bacterium CA13]